MSRTVQLKTLTVFLLVFEVLVSTRSARASVVVNATFDLNAISGTPGVSQTLNTISSSPIVTIGEGDEVELNYSFLGGQRLRMSQTLTVFSESIFEWLNVADASFGTFSISDIVVKFEGFAGSPGLSDTLTATFQSGGSAHLGPAFTNVLPSQGDFVEFTSLRATFTVDDLPASEVAYRPWLLIRADTLEALDSAAVPEAYSMAIWSFLSIGGFVVAKSRMKK
jgi:hypothetical protein